MITALGPWTELWTWVVFLNHISKSGFQGHSRPVVLLLFDTPHSVSY